MSTPYDPYQGHDDQRPGEPAPYDPLGRYSPAGHLARSRPPSGNGGNGPVHNGFGVVALVLGIVSIPAGGIVGIVAGIVLGILAVVLGVLGQGRVKRGEANNGGVAIAGLITGSLGIVISLGILVVALVLG
ncbi:MAG: DUF4190 domain-containing protein [Mycobacteriaceae bacterium]